MIRGVRGAGLTFLESGALLALYERVVEIERSSRPGILIEAGGARGGSAIVTAAARPE